MDYREILVGQSPTKVASMTAEALYLDITNKDLDFYLYGQSTVLPITIDESSIPQNQRKKERDVQTISANNVDILQLRYKPGVGKEFSSTEEFNKVLRAIKTIPSQLQLCYSSIPRAGFGICAKETIATGAWIGPYEGKRVSIQQLGSSPTDTKHNWEVYKNGSVDHYIGASETGQSVWMKYIQCARNANEQNLVVFQFGADIYFQTYKKIKAGEELLVWYAEYYEKHHDIPVGVRKVAKKVAVSQSSVESLDNSTLNFAARTPQITPASIGSITPTTRTAVTSTARKLFPEPIITQAISLSNNKYPILTRFWKCQHCKVIFPQKLALKVHVCPSRGLEEYKCKHCNKMFINNDNLQSHAAVCQETRRYICGYCSRKFPTEETLTKHLRVHSRRMLNGKMRRGRISNYEKFVLAKQL